MTRREREKGRSMPRDNRPFLRLRADHYRETSVKIIIHASRPLIRFTGGDQTRDIRIASESHAVLRFPAAFAADRTRLNFNQPRSLISLYLRHPLSALRLIYASPRVGMNLIADNLIISLVLTFTLSRALARVETEAFCETCRRRFSLVTAFDDRDHPYRDCPRTGGTWSAHEITRMDVYIAAQRMTRCKQRVITRYKPTNQPPFYRLSSHYRGSLTDNCSPLSHGKRFAEDEALINCSATGQSASWKSACQNLARVMSFELWFPVMVLLWLIYEIATLNDRISDAKTENILPILNGRREEIFNEVSSLKFLPRLWNSTK